jgi:hypothetical protein
MDWDEEQFPLLTHRELCEMMIDLWEKEIRLVETGLGFSITHHKQLVSRYKQILKQLK